jgi:DNA polymerase II small subunit/DNA polymerase delta subunit B
MIHFSHYCPTSPFSLKTEPYMEDDLVMEEMPNVMITGKAKSFGSTIFKMGGR